MSDPCFIIVHDKAGNEYLVPILKISYAHQTSSGAYIAWGRGKNRFSLTTKETWEYVKQLLRQSATIRDHVPVQPPTPGETDA